MSHFFGIPRRGDPESQTYSVPKHWPWPAPKTEFDASLQVTMGFIMVITGALLLLVVLTHVAFARNLGQWDEVGHSAEVRAWFQSLVQPDTVGRTGFGAGGTSCCGEADAYYADEVRYRYGHMIAVITDDRDDKPLGRAHEEIGTEYEIPQSKIVGPEQQLRGNPTGHVIIFLGGPSYSQTYARMNPRQVLCYVMNGGV